MSPVKAPLRVKTLANRAVSSLNVNFNINLQKLQLNFGVKNSCLLSGKFTIHARNLIASKNLFFANFASNYELFSSKSVLLVLEVRGGKYLLKRGS